MITIVCKCGECGGNVELKELQLQSALSAPKRFYGTCAECGAQADTSNGGPIVKMVPGTREDVGFFKD